MSKCFFRSKMKISSFLYIDILLYMNTFIRMSAKKDYPSLSIDLLQRMADVLRVLAHAHRLKIVELLQTRDAMPVYELMTSLDLPQPVTSQHLNHMKRVGLVASERRGKEVWYHIADGRALTILDCIRKNQELSHVH